MGLKESTEAVIRFREERLEEALEARRRIDEFPPELQELEGEVDTNPSGSISLKLSTISNKDRNLLRICKTVGIQGLAPKMSSNRYWFASGEGVLPNGDILNVTISSLEQPPNCIVEAYTETVTRYKAICPQTEGGVLRQKLGGNNG